MMKPLYYITNKKYSRTLNRPIYNDTKRKIYTNMIKVVNKRNIHIKL